MMVPHIDKIAVLALLLCAVIFVGEIFTYGVDIHNYDVDAEWSGDTLSYSVSSSGSDVYSVVLLDDGGFDDIETLYIYTCDTYDANYNSASSSSPITNFNQGYYAEQIQKMLKIRGFTDVKIVNDSSLISFIESTRADASTYGLLVSSYSVPSEIYTGQSTDALLEWTASGGSLYWIGSEIGKFYTDSSGLHEVENNQTLFFGKECVNVDDTKYALSAVDNEFKDALALKNSNLRFGLNISGLENSTSMGFCQDGYSSVSMVGFGSGMICVISGPFSIEQMDDVSQLIAAGISYKTEISNILTGKVVRSDIKETFDNTGGAVDVYIFIGGTYPVYGEAFHV